MFKRNGKRRDLEGIELDDEEPLISNQKDDFESQFYDDNSTAALSTDAVNTININDSHSTSTRSHKTRHRTYSSTTTRRASLSSLSSAQGLNLSADQDTCIICGIRSSMQRLYPLQPALQRQIQRMNPNRNLSDASNNICSNCMDMLIRKGVEDLIKQDQMGFSKLQETGMLVMERHERDEENWQDRFDRERTFGEKSADNVAKYAGSWVFCCSLLSFIAIWSLTNNFLAQWKMAWDEYPYILLNLFLSVLAALQGPVIMMSQNRQQEIDKLQNDFVSKVILRNELQSRNINAKLDHLVTSQWRRLLEMQGIQIELLQLLQKRSPLDVNGLNSAANSPRRFAASTPAGSASIPMAVDLSRESTPLSDRATFSTESTQMETRTFSLEIVPDPHTLMLLRYYYKQSSSKLEFQTQKGGKSVGSIDNVQLSISSVVENAYFDNEGWASVNPALDLKILRKISYQITFDSVCSLDDVFSGEGFVKYRNDFKLEHMYLSGRILGIEVYTKAKPNAPMYFQNGDLPSRYQPSFSNAFNRSERISMFFKEPVSKLIVTYHVPNQVVSLASGNGWRIKDLRVDFLNDGSELADVASTSSPTKSLSSFSSSPKSIPTKRYNKTTAGNNKIFVCQGEEMLNPSAYLETLGSFVEDLRWNAVPLTPFSTNGTFTSYIVEDVDLNSNALSFGSLKRAVVTGVFKHSSTE